MANLQLTLSAGSPEELEDKLLECLRAVTLSHATTDQLFNELQKRGAEEGFVLVMHGTGVLDEPTDQMD